MDAKDINALRPVRFACTYQSSAGELTADTQSCSFKSSSVQMEIRWAAVVSIKLKTKYIKEEPRSVILIKTTRHNSLSDRFRGASKHYFYNFEDIVEVSRVLLALKDANTESNTSENTRSSRRDDNAHKKNDTQTDRGVAKLDVDSKTSKYTTVIARQNAVEPNNNRGSPSRGAIGPKGDLERVSSLGSNAQRDREKFPEDIINEEENPQANALALTIHTHKDPVRSRRKVIDLPPSPPRYADGVVTSPRRTAPVQVPFGIRKDRRVHTQRAGNSRQRSNACKSSKGKWRALSVAGLDETGEGVQSRRCVVVALAVFALVAAVLFAAFAPRMHERSSHEMVPCVFDGLEQLRRWRIARQNDMLNTGASLREGMQQHKRQRLSSMRPPTLCVSSREMSNAVSELLKQYVAVQRDLVGLRVQRIKRENGDLGNVLAARRAAVVAVATAPGGNDEEGKGTRSAGRLHRQHSKQQASKESLVRKSYWAGQVAMDFRWYMNAVWSVFDFLWRMLKGGAYEIFGLGGGLKSSPVQHGATSASSVFSSSSASNLTVQYTEVLSEGHIVSERVTADDAMERRSCLRLSRELVRLEQLLRELLLEYQEVVMAPQYEALLHRIASAASMSRKVDKAASVKGSNRVGSDEEWISLLATDGIGVELRSDMPTMHRGELLNAIMLRRHAIALLGMDPFSQEMRIPVSDADTRRPRHKPNRNRDRRARPSDDESVKQKELMEIMQNFARSTAGATGTSTLVSGPAALLRNIAYELKYWHEHEKDWQDFVLLRLANASDRNSGALDGIADVPIFRGLWCFMERPMEAPPPKEKPQTRPEGPSRAPGERKRKVEEKVKSGKAQDAGNASHTSDSTALERGAPSWSLESNVTAENQSPADDQLQAHLHPEPLSRTSADVGREEVAQPQLEEHNAEKNAEGQQEEDFEYSDGEKESVPDSVGASKNENETESEADIMERRLRVVLRLSSFVHLRWMDALDLFLCSHGSPHKKSADSFAERGKLERSYAPESGDDDATFAFDWRRLLRFLLNAERNYDPLIAAGVAPVSPALLHDSKSFDTHATGGGLFSAFTARLWPQSQRPLGRRLHAMQRTDPAVRRLRRDLLHVQLGEMEDVPWVLLNVMTTPVNALRLQYDVIQVLRVGCGALVIVLAIFFALVLGLL